MKNSLLFSFLILLLLPFQSCEYITLSAKERAVKGYWKQSALVGKIVQGLYANKTFETFIGGKIPLIGEVVIYWKGNWEVKDDQLIRSVNEGPVFRISSNSYAEDFLNDLEKDYVDFMESRKIIRSTENRLVLDFNGVDETWKAATADEFTKLQKKFNNLK